VDRRLIIATVFIPPRRRERGRFIRKSHECRRIVKSKFSVRLSQCWCKISRKEPRQSPPLYHRGDQSRL